MPPRRPTRPTPPDVDDLRAALGQGKLVRVGIAPSDQFPDGLTGRVRRIGDPAVDGDEFIFVEVPIGGAKDVLPFAAADLTGPPARKRTAASSNPGSGTASRPKVPAKPRLSATQPAERSPHRPPRLLHPRRLHPARLIRQSANRSDPRPLHRQPRRPRRAPRTGAAARTGAAVAGEAAAGQHHHQHRRGRERIVANRGEDRREDRGTSDIHSTEPGVGNRPIVGRTQIDQPGAAPARRPPTQHPGQGGRARRPTLGAAGGTADLPTGLTQEPSLVPPPLDEPGGRLGPRTAVLIRPLPTQTAASPS